jgi:hypothetical protein
VKRTYSPSHTFHPIKKEKLPPAVV